MTIKMYREGTELVVWGKNVDCKDVEDDKIDEARLEGWVESPELIGEKSPAVVAEEVAHKNGEDPNLLKIWDLLFARPADAGEGFLPTTSDILREIKNGLDKKTITPDETAPFADAEPAAADIQGNDKGFLAPDQELSNDEVREQAKKAGIEGWDTKRIATLKSELNDAGSQE